MKKIGDRVGAILSADDKVVQLIGFGIYEGYFSPMEAIGMIAEICRELGHTNPRIKLDDGELVYGCECWWGSEAEVRKQLKGRVVIVVPPSKFREDYHFEENRAKAEEAKEAINELTKGVPNA